MITILHREPDDRLILVRVDEEFPSVVRPRLYPGYYIRGWGKRWYQWTDGGVRRIKWAEQVKMLEDELD